MLHPRGNSRQVHGKLLALTLGNPQRANRKMSWEQEKQLWNGETCSTPGFMATFPHGTLQELSSGCSQSLGTASCLLSLCPCARSCLFLAVPKLLLIHVIIPPQGSTGAGAAIFLPSQVFLALGSAGKGPGPSAEGAGWRKSWVPQPPPGSSG